eukprot:scaffold98991_cov47-Attheya_sp.AAC.2
MSFRWVLLWFVASVADGHPHATHHYVHGRSQSQDVVLDGGNKNNEYPLSNGRHTNGAIIRRITTPALLLHELRGGASKRSSQQKKKMANSEYYYGGLARALMPRLASDDQDGEDGDVVEEEKVSQALERLSKSQQALKGLDGAAHEAYQRTKAPSSVDSTSVAGRAARSAARTGCTADALLASELCDLFSLVVSTHDDYPTQQTTNATATSSHPFNFSTPTTTHTDNEEEDNDDDDHTLTGRHILLNITHVNVTYYDAKERNRLALPVSVLVLWEPDYVGGAGLDHGGVDGLLLVSTTTPTTTTTSLRQRVPKPRGRLLVLIQDGYATDLERTIACLDVEPQVVALNVGLVANEASSINGLLYKAAGQVLQTILPTLQTTVSHQNETTTTNSNNNNNDDDQESLPAIHFVGQSLAGGIASLAATILDGSLSMPQSSSSSSSKKRRRGSQSSNRKRNRRKRGAATTKEETTTEDDHEKEKGDESKELKSNNTTRTTMLGRSDLSGHGRGRTSALVLGAPPCLSGNVKAAFVTSIIYGDDIICRTTRK